MLEVVLPVQRRGHRPNNGIFRVPRLRALDPLDVEVLALPITQGGNVGVRELRSVGPAWLPAFHLPEKRG